MRCDEEEGSAKKGKGDSHSSFGLDLRDDPGCDCGMLHLCVFSVRAITVKSVRFKTMWNTSPRQNPFMHMLLLANIDELASDSNILI